MVKFDGIKYYSREELLIIINEHDSEMNCQAHHVEYLISAPQNPIKISKDLYRKFGSRRHFSESGVVEIYKQLKRRRNRQQRRKRDPIDFDFSLLPAP